MASWKNISIRAIVILGAIMYLCYVEESGDSGTFNASDPNSNPFFIISGLFVEASHLQNLTDSFLRSKLKFFPSLRPALSVRFLDCIELEWWQRHAHMPTFQCVSGKC